MIKNRYNYPTNYIVKPAFCWPANIYIQTKSNYRTENFTTECHYTLCSKQGLHHCWSANIYFKSFWMELQSWASLKVRMKRCCQSPIVIAEKQKITYIAITKTCLYNTDPLKPHLYIVKLGFTGVCIIFSYCCSKYRLWVLVRTASPRRF